MSESKHTPGPFMVSRGAQGFPFSIESATKTIAFIRPLGTPGETQANANLFKAAPNMLKVLESAKQFCQALERDAPSPFNKTPLFIIE